MKDNQEKPLTPGDLWQALGDLDELETTAVLTSLFALFETRLTNNPGDQAALEFFHQLALVIERTGSCNLNRR